ncbi:MAG TPA: hypothetical protein VNZ64_02330 [Candidatus Acidoferrum sp.]|nr:hypothetical protein [Candidatus Acidoferrum sp.]
MALSSHPDGQIGVLAGARLPAQLSQFREVFNGFSAEPAPAQEQPDVLRARAPEAGPLIERAARIGLTIQVEAPLAILSSLPNVLQLQKWHARPGTLPRGREWQVSVFQIARRHHAWKQSSTADAASAASGLFRFTRYQRAWHYLKLNGQTLEIGSQVGKLFLLARRRKQVMHYNRSDSTLTIPAICRPPLPVDRALILCSGSLPAMDPASGALAYAGITEDIAGHAAAILSQNSL